MTPNNTDPTEPRSATTRNFDRHMRWENSTWHILTSYGALIFWQASLDQDFSSNLRVYNRDDARWLETQWRRASQSNKHN